MSPCQYCMSGCEMSPSQYCMSGCEMSPCQYCMSGCEMSPCQYCMSGCEMSPSQYCMSGCVRCVSVHEFKLLLSLSLQFLCPHQVSQPLMSCHVWFVHVVMTMDRMSWLPSPCSSHDNHHDTNALINSTRSHDYHPRPHLCNAHSHPHH